MIPFFMWAVFRKLDKFLGETRHSPPSIGDVANTFAHLLGPSGVFPGHRFGRSKIAKSKLQRTLQTPKTPKMQNVSGNKGVVLEAWRPC